MTLGWRRQPELVRLLVCLLQNDTVTKQVVKVIWHRPHRRRTRKLQSYSPRGASAHAIYYTSIGIRTAPYRCYPLLSSFEYVDRRTEHVWTCHGAGLFFGLKIALSVWGPGPPSNTWFLGPTRVHVPDGISMGPTVFTGLTVVTDRQTDMHSTPSVAIGRI